MNNNDNLQTPHNIILENKIQGDYPLELKFVDDNRVYLNFWDMVHGKHINCQIKGDKIYKFNHSSTEIEADELLDKPLIEDVFKQTEISLTEFLELIQKSIAN